MLRCFLYRFCRFAVLEPIVPVGMRVYNGNDLGHLVYLFFLKSTEGINKQNE